MSSPAVLDQAAVRDDTAAGARRGGLFVVAGYAVLLVVVTVLSLGWLVVGAVVGAAAHLPSVAAGLGAAAAGGSRWARGVLEAIPRSEPFGQAVLDYAFSLLSIGVAVGLLVRRRGSRPARLLVLALVGSAGAFNLQAHAADTAVQVASGLAVGGLHQVVLHGIACAAYILALLMFPPDQRAAGPGGLARAVLVAAGVGTLVLVGFGTALLPHTTSCVLFFGFLVPLAGLVTLPRRIRHGTTAAARAQARMLFSVLAAAMAVAVVLAIITVVLWSIGFAGLGIVDPTAHAGPPEADEPTALLFWFARLASIAIAAAVFLATGGARGWTAEGLFSRGLVAALVAALVGGGYVVVRTVLEQLVDDGDPAGAFSAATLAVVPAALAFLPVYVRVERFVDRLLYGARPTPYSVLAGIAALSRATTGDAPDLARVAEAVGRGLGATTCRLTVVRPELHDRAYTWVEPGAQPSDALAEVAVRHGSERIGTIAVDHAAVAGLQGQRRHLLEDIADSLGAVFQASRSGIELERQLRAALAHAGEIAESRRAVVAEMDGERRRIERDLHDGAQHHLVSLRLTLGLVEHQVSTGQFDQARGRLEQVAEQIDTAESILAETATGVSSPLLAEQGLVGALRTELRGGHPPVTLDCDGVAADAAIPADVQAAVFFCCLEAVNNARKHAGGAAIGVWLVTEDGRVRFAVHDEGPGWDLSAGAGSPGRGMRNLTARIAAVGGRIEVRSEPGEGTVVAGSAPLPRPAEEPEADAAAPGRTGPAVAAAAPGLSLIDQVRDALRTARALYHGTCWADPLRALAQRLDEPLRVGVAGPAGADVPALVEALRSAAGRAGTPALDVTLVDMSVPHSGPDDALVPVAEAFVLLLGPPGNPEPVAGLPAPLRPALAIGVPVDAAAGLAHRPDTGTPCHVVTPVAPCPDVPHLLGLIAARFALRAESLKARAALLALESMVRADPPPVDGRALVYRLDRIRSGAHELTEIDLVDALRSGELDLPDGEREVAERLLGAQGADPRARLALAPAAGPREVARAAGAQLVRWQGVAAHPMSGKDLRDVAAVLVQTCEQLLARAGLHGGRAGAPH
ncbi:sensor histidine kinase [Pseudonocardia xinjiangensis]|uniref:sensor histidine kinase n=1 Tax=Pseudonocardia xinjiangensis TaxID=75289 RepID=UPI0031D5595B